MSESTTSVLTPLQEAQQLVARLRTKMGGQAGASDNNDLKSDLARLDDLLKQASTRGEGQDADALRTRLNSSIDRTASFNSMMVHEIRKPMTSIRGYTD